MAWRAFLGVFLTALLTACEREAREPIGPPIAPRESAVLRFERWTVADRPDEVLTATALGHVTWREVPSGAVTRVRISVDELLALERAFDDARLTAAPDTVRGSRCDACPTLLLAHGIGAGERIVVVTGDPAAHPPALRGLVARLSAVAARAAASRGR